MGMIHCREAAYYLSLRSGKALTLPQKGQLAFHLMICRNCRRYRDQLRWMDATLDSIAESADNVRLSHDARRRIEDKTRRLS